jgi:formylmethanofuran dehydrogenase subunit E
MIMEKLVEKTARGGRNTFVFTDLGKVVFALISTGLNEGIISPTCSL